ncbi:MAG TPA: endonuclease/exonuclease/phosphatase family protein, partial [Solirubrobacterales bacterium]|nr:endonuclease/exonuclease/phosphatase family protein [Solirubrobacterales bacterium]
ALAITLLPGAADAKGKSGKGTHQLTVMSRNLYLGADLSPALNSTTLDGAVNAAYQIEQQVHRTKFPSVRAAELAAEIKKQKPDIVGLQEGAWWRTGPYDLGAVTSPKATQTDPAGGDFLTDLLNQLNSGGGKKSGASATKKKKPKLQYRIAVVKPEFDYELPITNNPGGLGFCNANPSQCHNERLTMRDAILVKKGVKTSKATSGTFNTLLRVKVGGLLSVDVTRGWAAVDAKVNGKKVHVVDSHLEAFDSDASNTGSDGQTYPKGGIREAQAKQLIAPGGPTTSKLPTLLVGDFNSDFPVHGDQVDPGDALAYRALLAGGWSERALRPPPFGCCLQDPNLNDPSTAGITHRVDHIMSNSKKIKFKKGGLTTTYAKGLHSSDHFGLWSRLQVK